MEGEFRAAADAWNRGDLDAVLAAYHPDAVFVLIGGFENLVGREFRGRAGIRKFFDEYRAAFGEVHIEIEEAIPVGDRLVVVQRQRNRGRAGGAETTVRYGSVLSYQDELIIRSENYYTVDDALAAVGLSE